MIANGFFNLRKESIWIPWLALMMAGDLPTV
jgi:hypothetical protein